MENKYFQSLREYILAIICAVLFSLIMPIDFVKAVQNSFISILSLIPITTPMLLLANLGTMVLILILGLIYIESVSFFLVLNGFAFGIILSLYKSTLALFFSLLFPHFIFETILIIIYCSQVKILSNAYTKKDTKQIKFSWQIILCVCLPLWLLSGVLEGMSVR